MSTSARTVGEMIDEMPLTRRYWTSMSLLGALTIADYFDFYVVAFLVAVLGPQWNLTFGQSAIILLSAGLGSIVGALVWGSLSDHHGRRVALVLGTVLCGVSAASVALVPDGGWVLFAVLRFFVGVGLAGAATPGMALAVEYTPRRWRTILTGLLVVAATVGTLIASTTIAGLLSYLGWRGVAVVGIVPAFLGLVVLAVAPESARWLASRGRMGEARQALARMAGVPASALAMPAADAGSPGTVPFSALLRDTRRFWLTILLWAGTLTANYGIYLWGPTLVALLLGATPAETARIFMLVSLMGILGKIIFSILPQKLGRRRCNEIGCFGIVIVLVAVALFHDERIAGVPVLAPLLILGALFFDGVIANLAPYTVEIYPTELAARGYGLGQAANGVGKIAGPLVLALIAGASNFVAPKATIEAATPAFLFLAACALASALASVLLPIDPLEPSAEAAAHAADPVPAAARPSQV